MISIRQAPRSESVRWWARLFSYSRRITAFLEPREESSKPLLFRRFDRAQLLEHPEHVPIGPTLGNLAIRNAINHDAGPTGTPSRSQNAHHFAFLRAAGNKLRRNHIPFGDLRDDPVLEIGKRFMERGNKLPPRVESANCFSAVRMMMLMVHVIAPENLLETFFAAMCPKADSPPGQIFFPITTYCSSSARKDDRSNSSRLG